MSTASLATGALVRVSIVSEGRRLDVGVPSQVPLVELLPGFARNLGVLDPTLTHGGYTLQRADASTLDAAQSLGSQGVRDGELLTLQRGGLIAAAQVYDDVVEAVIDATRDKHSEWSPRDSARTALAISLSLLGLCAVLLAGTEPGFGIGTIIAAAGTLVLTATAAVLTRIGQPEAGHALGLAAAGFGGLAGYLAVPSTALWGWPLAAAGLGSLIVGGIVFAVTTKGRQLHIIPIVIGLAIAASAAIYALLDDGGVAPYAIMIAVIATLSNGVPWLALSSTRIRIISPQNDQEIFAAPQQIDSNDIRRRTEEGQRMLVALRIALGAAVLIATPLVAASAVTGAILCALAFAGMMFQSRQTYARVGVTVIMAIGAAGLVVTGLTAFSAFPELHAPMLTLILIATTVLVTLTLLSPRARLRLARLADTVELLILALLLPLGVATAGLA
ncbi:MAG: type VII secretion integral membrane protein EccD [Cryobacterium sp.]|nr:type VII secretion integral membrane protein EccD [Cryobacterium sp.]